MLRHSLSGVMLSDGWIVAVQEVPTLLSLPQGPGSPIWLIMTGVTTGIQGYNRLISKIVPLTAAARSVDLIPFMVVNCLIWLPPWRNIWALSTISCGCP